MNGYPSPRSVLADDRPVYGVDGLARHFAIVCEHCQHVDELTTLLAQTSTDDVPAHAHFDLTHGFREPHELVLGDLGTLLGPRQAMALRRGGSDRTGHNTGHKQQLRNVHRI